MTFTDKRALAAECFRRIAAAVERAPDILGAHTTPWSADDILGSLFEGHDGPFTLDGPDPTATDGRLTWCPICEDEAHSPSCPVAVLDHLSRVGVSGSGVLPPNVGLMPNAVRDGRHLLRS